MTTSSAAQVPDPPDRQKVAVRFGSPAADPPQNPSVTVNVTNWRSLTGLVVERIKARQGFAIATLNADHVFKLNDDDAFLAAYRKHDIITADGFPVVAVSWLVGRPVIRVTGADMIRPLVKVAASLKCPIAVVGSSPGSVRKAIAILQSEAKDARFVFVESPPMDFAPLSGDGDALLQRIGDSGAGLCFLAFGAPKQELLAGRGRVVAPDVGFVSIGAGIDFISGYQVRAPKVLQLLWLEWLWRLLSDPQRFGVRYFNAFKALPGFAWRAITAARAPAQSALPHSATPHGNAPQGIGPQGSGPPNDGSLNEGPPPLRVCYFVNQYPAGSHTFIRREIHAVERQGVEVLRTSLRGWDNDLVDPADQAERIKTRFVLQESPGRMLAALMHCLVRKPSGLAAAARAAWRMTKGSDRAIRYHLFYLVEACVLARWVETWKAGHIHAHFATNSAEVAMLAHLIGGVPYSFTLHGPEEFDRPLQLGLPEKVRNASFVCAISSFGRSQLLRFIPHELWDKVHVVRCGLEFSHRESPAPGPGSRVKFVSVGRLSEQKGQLLLVEAAGQLATCGIDFELALVGDGILRPEIEHRIAELGLTSRVRITGWLSNADVEAELKGCRALVLPSFAEGLPVAIMESLAQERPVISTYIAGIPELVTDGICGWLVPAGDAAAIAGAMRDCLARSDEDIARMGRAGRDRVKAMHDIDDTAMALVQAIRHVANGCCYDASAESGAAGGAAKAEPAKHSLDGASRAVRRRAWRSRVGQAAWRSRGETV